MIKKLEDVKIYVKNPAYNPDEPYILVHPAVGDVVSLKSDIQSPKMTIESFEIGVASDGREEEFVHCVWFDGPTLHRNRFYGNLLIRQ